MIPLDSALQTADTNIRAEAKVDSVLAVHSPRKAAIRSAILPGWGQAYNKKYWKIPIVYGALGTTAGIFVYNVKNYRALRYAVIAKTRALPDTSGFRDSSLIPGIRKDLLRIDLEALRFNRNEFRRNIDYTVLVFVLFWGLNVVDAAVDAHLKSFDVSPDLSFRIKPGISPMGGTTGISFILALK